MQKGLMAVEDNFYFGLVDSLHLINRHHSDLAILIGANQGCMIKSLCVSIGTLEGGYVRNVPLPRILLRQSASRVACAATLTESTDTYYSKVPWIPTSSEITRSLEGLGKTAIMPFFPCWLV
jgi:hypothetical protein